MDNKLERQIAVWYLSHEMAEDLRQALDFVRLVEKGEATEEMATVLSKNLDIRLQLGGNVTADSALKFLQDKRKTAEKLIAMWEENPKDTNAVFFFRDFNAVDWDSVK